MTTYDKDEREALAAVQHEIWNHWMTYLLGQCMQEIPGPTTTSTNGPRSWGDLIIPAKLVARWRRQMATPYDKLSEEEQQSDLEQADKVLAVLKRGNAR